MHDTIHTILYRRGSSSVLSVFVRQNKLPERTQAATDMDVLPQLVLSADGPLHASCWAAPCPDDVRSACECVHAVQALLTLRAVAAMLPRGATGRWMKQYTPL